MMKTLLVGAALVAMGGAALAHHSFAMFDQEHPIELSGVVKDWKYTAPHAFIILDVKETDGTTQTWSLEGGAPSGLIRDGWTSKTLKPGDELTVKVDPLRSGARAVPGTSARSSSRTATRSFLQRTDNKLRQPEQVAVCGCAYPPDKRIVAAAICLGVRVSRCMSPAATAC